MKAYKDYFEQILTGLMHILIEHSDLLRRHTWDFGFFIQVRSTMPSFKLKFSLGFITSCYVIFSLSMVQAMDIFMIT